MKVFHPANKSINRRDLSTVYSYSSTFSIKEKHSLLPDYALRAKPECHEAALLSDSKKLGPSAAPTAGLGHFHVNATVQLLLKEMHDGRKRPLPVMAPEVLYVLHHEDGRVDSVL